MVEKLQNGDLKISGRVDSNNANQLEEELIPMGVVGQAMTIDLGDLEYISSAGLRVLLRLKKTIKDELKITNVSNDIYDIFDVTGFTDILTVEKKMRNVSIEGCELIGQGANGKVYQLDNETIIKVFTPDSSVESVREERDFAQAAFLAGVPTAISFDVVKVDDCYGAVYEMLNAKTLSQVIKSEPERVEEFGRRMGTLLKELHETPADKNKLTNMTATYKERAKKLGAYLEPDEVEKLTRIYGALEERGTLLHGDYHMKNIMYMDNELIFIDMGDVGYGHPILDVGGSYLAMMDFGKRSPEHVEHYLGVDYETSKKIWNAMTLEYFGEKNVQKGRELAELFGMAKYTLIPMIFTRFGTEEKIKGMIAQNRQHGLLSKEVTLPAVLDEINEIL